MLTGYAGEPFRRGQNSSEGLRTLWAEVRSRPALCGLGLYERPFAWAWTLGYTGLNRPVPIFLAQGPEALARARQGFNYLIATSRVMPELDYYQPLSCAGEYCLLAREQARVPVPEMEINAVLVRQGQ
jgi:hypothetical protein